MDPIKIFIKQEPHKLSKINYRERLILAVSMVDTMVDRMLFTEWAKAVQRLHPKLPMAVGWSPVNGGYRQLLARFPGKAYMSDKQAWDWTAQGWIFKLCKAILFELGPANEEWRKLVEYRFACLFELAVMQFSDGTLVQQQGPGIQKSGCFLTILINTLAQICLIRLAEKRLGMPMGERDLWAMGDDTIEDVPPSVEQYTRMLELGGCIIKEYQCSDDLEFIGFTYPRDQIPVPAYLDKHVYNLVHCEESVYCETLEQYLLLHLNSPLNPWLKMIASQFPPGTFPTDWKFARIWKG